MTVLGALASRASVSNAVQATPWGDWGDSGSDTWSGTPVSNTTALQLLTVYGCNRFICDGISTLPVDVLRRRGDGSPEPMPTPQVIAQPTTDLDFTAWATQALTSLLMAGNFYGFRRYSGTTLAEVIPIDPDRVIVKREKGRKVFYIEGRPFSTFEIMHIPGVMWPGAEVGMSPLEAARQTIGQGMSAQEFGARFFGQGASLSGVIEVPGELLPDKARELARSWGKKHGGKSKANLPGVLQGGAVWKPTGVTNEQSQFLETRKFTASEIAAQMFMIDPPEMGLPVDGTSLTYANQEQRNARKVQVTFLPWIVRLERALTSMIPRGQYVKLNVNGLLRGDMKTRFESYGIGIDKKFMVPNEAREFEDWQPLPGGDSVVEKAAPVAPDLPAAVVEALSRRPVDAERAPIVNVHPANVHVDVQPAAAPEVRLDGAIVNLAQPPVNVTVEPPQVTVEAPQVTVENIVPVPVVNVTNDVQPAPVTVVDKPKTRTVVRDNQGNIVKVVEE